MASVAGAGACSPGRSGPAPTQVYNRPRTSRKNQLGYLHSILKGQTADLTQDDSLFQPPGGGNCANWLVGHVVTSRNQMLEMLGRPPIWGRMSEPGTPSALLRSRPPAPAC